MKDTDWSDVVKNSKTVTTPSTDRQASVLAAGCLLSVMAVIYTTIGFVIGFVVRGL